MYVYGACIYVPPCVHYPTCGVCEYSSGSSICIYCIVYVCASPPSALQWLLLRYPGAKQITEGLSLQVDYSAAQCGDPGAQEGSLHARRGRAGHAESGGVGRQRTGACE